MNRIKSIKINNYRSCVQTELEFYGPLGVLIGINGVGKTNILTAISSLKDMKTNTNNFYQLKKLLKTDPSTVVAKISIDKSDVDIKAEFFLEFDEYREKINYSKLSYKLSGTRNWRKIEKEYFNYADILMGNNKYYSPSKYRSIILGSSSQDFDLKYSIIKLLDDIVYFGATKFVDPSKCPSSLDIKGNRVGPMYSRHESHVGLLKDLYKAYQDKKPFIKFLNVVGKNGLNLVDNIKFDEIKISNTSSNVTIDGHLTKKEEIRKIVVPTVNVDGLNLSFSQLSEGTFKSLATIFYILTSSKQILLIEEPEVCVHQGLLSSILELIISESKNKQIIISTHSDFVLDKIEPHNLIVVVKNGEVGTKAQPLDKIMDKDDYNYLKKYLDESGNLGEYWRETGFLDE